MAAAVVPLSLPGASTGRSGKIGWLAGLDIVFKDFFQKACLANANVISHESVTSLRSIHPVNVQHTNVYSTDGTLAGTGDSVYVHIWALLPCLSDHSVSLGLKSLEPVDLHTENLQGCMGVVLNLMSGRTCRGPSLMLGGKRGFFVLWGRVAGGLPQSRRKAVQFSTCFPAGCATRHARCQHCAMQEQWLPSSPLGFQLKR